MAESPKFKMPNGKIVVAVSNAQARRLIFHGATPVATDEEKESESIQQEDKE